MAEKTLWCSHVESGEERVNDGGLSTVSSLEQVCVRRVALGRCVRRVTGVYLPITIVVIYRA